MSLLKHIGEIEDFGGGGALVPESYYPVTLVVGDVNVGSRRDGSAGTPFVELIGTVTEGPYKGARVEPRLYLTAGKLKDAGSGAMLGFLASATKAVTGEPANEGAFTEAGFIEPDTDGLDENEAAAIVRQALVEFYHQLDSAAQLDVMAKFTKIPKWQGKTVVAHIGLDTEDAEGQPLRFPRNRWSGFFPLNHPKRGLEFCRKVAFGDQKAAIEQGA